MTPEPAVRDGTAHPPSPHGAGFAAGAAAASSAGQPLDDIASLARHLCGTTAALVARLEPGGLAVRAGSGLEPGELEGAQAFCAHALQAENPVEIADLRGDARFAAHPLVAGGAGLRFCAGIGLAGPGGRLGSLCVLDRQPRLLEGFQRDALSALARTAAALIAPGPAGPGPAGAAPPAWSAAPRAEPPRGLDARYAVAIIELDGDSLPAPARERAMRQVQQIAAAELGADDVLSRDGPGELLAVFAHAARAPVVLERIAAVAAALPDAPRLAIGAAAGRHGRDAMEDVFLEAESALQRARMRDRLRVVFAAPPGLDA